MMVDIFIFDRSSVAVEIAPVRGRQLITPLCVQSGCAWGPVPDEEPQPRAPIVFPGFADRLHDWFVVKSGCPRCDDHSDWPAGVVWHYGLCPFDVKADGRGRASLTCRHNRTLVVEGVLIPCSSTCSCNAYMSPR